jgi:hypothetical protein
MDILILVQVWIDLLEHLRRQVVTAMKFIGNVSASNEALQFHESAGISVKKI